MLLLTRCRAKSDPSIKEPSMPALQTYRWCVQRL
jgi:hypothetical protein